MNNAQKNISLLDDFYAESDEHLIELRKALGQLDSLPVTSTVPADISQTLSRQLHSLKGILGIAGLADCERLTHSAEDYLRHLLTSQCRPGPEAVDILSELVHTLEHAVTAHREKKPIPAVTDIQARINGLFPAPVRDAGRSPAGHQPSGQLPDPALEPKLQAARSAGKHLYIVRFTPSPELNQAGVNINSVRALLQELGELIHSVPLVQPGGGIEFEFTLATDRPAPELARLHTQGLTLTQLPPAPEMGAHPAPSAKAPSEAPRPIANPAYVTPSHLVRVDLSRLDELMRTVGEMVVQRARLEDFLGRVERILPTREARELQEITDGFGRELRRLRDGLMRVRLVPIAEIFDRMALVVRDVSREQGRKIQITIQGQETQIDKYIVERLKDPLLHLVRNAGTHALEPAAERAARGKPEALTITLRAATMGDSVLLEVADDGGGIDIEKVRQQAQRAGMSVPENFSPDEILEFLCTPGFSTREQADLVAGRGVGMAVVKETLTRLGGELRLETQPGQGTTFQLRLPLTLAVAEAILITVSGQRFAVLQAGLQEILTLDPAAIVRLENAEFIPYRQGILPLARLSRLFELKETVGGARRVLVVGHGEDRAGLIADSVQGQREIIVRALSDPLFKIPAVSGATELGDGRAVLILDVISLVRTVLGSARTARTHPPAEVHHA